MVVVEGVGGGAAARGLELEHAVTTTADAAKTQMACFTFGDARKFVDVEAGSRAAGSALQLAGDLFLPQPSPRDVRDTIISVTTTSSSRRITRAATARGPTPGRSSRRRGVKPPATELRRLGCENAADPYRHPPPGQVLPL